MNAPIQAESLARTEAGSPVKLYARGLGKRYGLLDALKPIDLQVNDGELLTLLGPSGSGKTTLLQLIAGLVPPSTGKLIINGIDQTNLAPNKRDIGVVFQSYSLFPHLTVQENVAFPLQMRKCPKDEVMRRVTEALGMVGLGNFSRRFPHELSGGQQQRVALARCLVYQPSLILMDESLSALDRKLREAMQVEIKRLHRETGATIIFVTHDQEEALALSDRVCLMNEGQIEQIGTPADLYDRPRTEFVAGFIGISNIIRGRFDGAGLFQSSAADEPLRIVRPVAANVEATYSIRPEFVKLMVPGSGFINGTIAEQIYAGSETKILVKLTNGATFTVRQPAGGSDHHIGEAVSLSWSQEHLRLLEPKSS